ncbi:hypothetical protein C8Q77DRAFT_1151026 [Trametes polyzona]|nr:hypothetical protein C8Q77DRAFT_1151026 [Trametes polyzona]
MQRQAPRLFYQPCDTMEPEALSPHSLSSTDSETMTTTLTQEECQRSPIHLTMADEPLRAEIEAAVFREPEPYGKPSDLALLQEHVQNAIKHSNDDVQKNVLQLTSTIRDIKDSFKDIGRDLHTLELAAQTSVVVGEVAPQPLKTQWESLENTFDDLLEVSYKNARDAITVLQNFNDLFPDNLVIENPEQFEDIKTEVGNLITSIADDQQNAHELEKDFSSLATQISYFGITITKICKPRNDRSDRLLQEAHTKIADLRARLETANSKLRHAGVTCVASLSVGAISAAHLFFTLSPSSASMLVASVLASVPSFARLTSHNEDAKGIEAELDKSMHEVAELVKGHALLSEYHRKFAGTIDNLCTKIVAIANIWHVLNADFQELHSSLTMSVGPKLKYTSRVNKKIQNTREIYKRLQVMLQAYVNGVDAFEKAQ